jgi:hypothetical protein
MEKVVVQLYIKRFITTWSLHDPWGPSFVANVVIIDSIKEIGALSVINWPTCVVVKLNTIVNIYKYRRLHEGHHFIPMALEVHDTLEGDMYRFIRECAFFSHNILLGGHLSLSFCIQVALVMIKFSFLCKLCIFHPTSCFDSLSKHGHANSSYIEYMFPNKHESLVLSTLFLKELSTVIVEWIPYVW